MGDKMKMLSKLKDMMPKTPEVEDAFSVLEEQAAKNADEMTDNEDMPETSGDEDMGLELDMSDDDAGGEGNPTDIMSADEEDSDNQPEEEEMSPPPKKKPKKGPPTFDKGSKY